MPRETIQHARIVVRHEEPPVVFDEHGGNLQYPLVSAIVDREYVPNEALGVHDTLIEGSAVSLHWSRDAEYVQIGIEAPRKFWDSFIQGYDSSKELHRYELYTESLTRKEINDLIKVLRRARDAAYGTDE